ncbi:MAG: hypothetical protein J1E83_05815 [Lachnospiraceae bacterium]|nr:hypothetical protein [Lachnospiraceae bacterium]
MIFHKKKRYQMNVAQADATLQKVFAACKQSPNTTSFDKILLRRQLNTKLMDNMLVLTAIILLLTFLSPLGIASVNAVFPGKESPSQVTLLSDNMTDGVLCLTLSGSGILYGDAYQETETGIVEKAISYDKNAGTICFTYYGTVTNIYIPLENAPVFHLVLAPQ